MDWHQPEFWMIVGSGMICLYLGFTLFSRWLMNSPAVPEQKLELVRVGMTTEEVHALLGEPRRIRITDKQLLEYIYGLRMKRHVLCIVFGNDKRVQHFVHSSGIRLSGQKQTSG